MKKELTKIDEIKGKEILFDKDGEYFIVGENRYSSLHEAKKAIQRDLETEFKGEFFVRDRFEGICKFVSQRKIYDEYDGCYKIIGKIERMGNNRGEFKENELYPISEYNLSQQKKAKEMDTQGWSLINEAKRFPLKK